MYIYIFFLAHIQSCNEAVTRDHGSEWEGEQLLLVPEFLPTHAVIEQSTHLSFFFLPLSLRHQKFWQVLWVRTETAGQRQPGQTHTTTHTYTLRYSRRAPFSPSLSSCFHIHMNMIMMRGESSLFHFHLKRQIDEKQKRTFHESGMNTRFSLLVITCRLIPLI